MWNDKDRIKAAKNIMKKAMNACVVRADGGAARWVPLATSGPFIVRMKCTKVVGKACDAFTCAFGDKCTHTGPKISCDFVMKKAAGSRPLTKAQTKVFKSGLDDLVSKAIAELQADRAARFGRA